MVKHKKRLNPVSKEVEYCSINGLSQLVSGRVEIVMDENVTWAGMYPWGTERL